MLPGKYPIVINQRATFRRRVILPIDLTGHQVYAQVWDTKRRVKYQNFEINIIDASNGEFDLIMEWDASSELTSCVRNAYYDLMVVYANGNRDYWLEGPVTIDTGLTAPEDE